MTVFHRLSHLPIKCLLMFYSCVFSACNKSIKLIPTLPDYMACHIDELCSHIVCCIDIGVIGLSLTFDLHINLCGNSITAGFEEVTKSFENALTDYDWGRHQYL